MRLLGESKSSQFTFAITVRSSIINTGVDRNVPKPVSIEIPNLHSHEPAKLGSYFLPAEISGVATVELNSVGQLEQGETA